MFLSLEEFTTVLDVPNSRADGDTVVIIHACMPGS